MTFSLNIHSLVTVQLCKLNSHITERLKDYFSLFSSDHAEISGNYDITVTPFMTDKKSLELLSRDIQPFWVKELSDDSYVVVGHRGKPDMAFNVSGPITIEYREETQEFGRLLFNLTYCIQLSLIRKGGLLFHGAVLSQDNNCVMIVGPSGIGKTALTLTMLNDGWDYVGDDKFILYKGKAHIFRPYIPMERFHFEFLPKHNRMVTDHKRFKYPVLVSKLAKIFVENYSPDFIIPMFNRLRSPAVFVNVKDMFPQSREQTTAIPSKCVVITHGSSFRAKECSHDEIIRDIINLQWLHFPDFEKMTRILSLSDYSYYRDFEAVIAENLSNMRFLKLNFPYEWNHKKRYQSLISGINS
ncbi:MAG: hypothetical protein H7843_05715 [Nitrospirota bacterium]